MRLFVAIFLLFVAGNESLAGDKDYSRQIQDWVSLYRQVGIKLDPALVSIPDRTSGFDRLIVIPKGLTFERVLKLLREDFAVDPYFEGLDSYVKRSDRTSIEGYAVWVRDTVDADQYQGLSYAQVKERGVKAETLLERFIHEFVYFKQTGKHLDPKSWTLCYGSEGKEDDFPAVYWNSTSKALKVIWISSPTELDGSMGIREVLR